MSDGDVLFDCGCLKFALSEGKLYATVKCKDTVLFKAVKECFSKKSSEGDTFEVETDRWPDLLTIRSCMQALSPMYERSWEPSTLTPASDAIHFLEKVTPDMEISTETVVLASSHSSVVSAEEKKKEKCWPGTCWMYRKKKEEPKPQAQAQAQQKDTQKDKQKDKQKGRKPRTTGTEPANPPAISEGERWRKMCQLMDVVRTMLDASYRESKMEGARGEEPVPHPMEFFFDNWPNFAEAQLSSLLRMSVLGHFMRICGVQSITLDEFKKFHTTAVELSDCDIAYFMVQALRSVHKHGNTDKCSDATEQVNNTCSDATERVNNTRLMFYGEKGEVFRQFKVECACIEGERLAFMIELLERLSGTTLENMKNKGSLTFQSLMERIERAKNEKVLLTNRQEKEKEEKEKKKDEEKEEEEKKKEEEEKKKEKDLMAYSMSVFFEVCTSDVTWPPSPEDPENSEDPDAPEYPEVPAAVAAAAE